MFADEISDINAASSSDPSPTSALRSMDLRISLSSFVLGAWYFVRPWSGVLRPVLGPVLGPGSLVPSPDGPGTRHELPRTKPVMGRTFLGVFPRPTLQFSQESV